MPSKSLKNQGGTCAKKGGSQLQWTKIGGKRKTLRKTYRKSKRGGNQQQGEYNENNENYQFKGGKTCDGYCVSCKQKRSMKDCKDKKTKNGRNMVAGVCEKCGTKMAKFVK
jgi:hypothetical protein